MFVKVISNFFIELYWGSKKIRITFYILHTFWDATIALQVIDKYPNPEIFYFLICALNYEYEGKAQVLIDKMNQDYPNHAISLYYQLLSFINLNNTFDIEIIFDKIQNLRYIKITSTTAVYICLSHAIYRVTLKTMGNPYLS